MQCEYGCFYVLRAFSAVSQAVVLLFRLTGGLSMGVTVFVLLWPLRSLRVLPLRLRLGSRLASVQCGFIRARISGRSRSNGSEALELLSSRYDGYAEVTGLVGPGDELRFSGSELKESLEMRAESPKGDSAELFEVRNELPPPDENTVERCHCRNGSDSGRNPGPPSTCSSRGDLAETNPESTLDLLPCRPTGNMLLRELCLSNSGSGGVTSTD